MKEKTHIAMMHRCLGYRPCGPSREIKLHETARYWIDERGMRFSKGDGYANKDFKIDLTTVRPIGGDGAAGEGK